MTGLLGDTGKESTTVVSVMASEHCDGYGTESRESIIILGRNFHRKNVG